MELYDFPGRLWVGPWNEDREKLVRVLLQSWHHDETIPRWRPSAYDEDLAADMLLEVFTQVGVGIPLHDAHVRPIVTRDAIPI
jgi:hypothetical protein